MFWHSVYIQSLKNYSEDFIRFFFIRKALRVRAPVNWEWILHWAKAMKGSDYLIIPTRRRQWYYSTGNYGKPKQQERWPSYGHTNHSQEQSGTWQLRHWRKHPVPLWWVSFHLNELFLFQYNTDILALNINQYQCQSNISTLHIIQTLITYFIL